MIVNVGTFGRLGNRIWTLANLYAFARSHGVRAIDSGLPLPDRFAFQRSNRTSQTSTTPPCPDLNLNHLTRRSLRFALRAAVRARIAERIDAGESLCLDADRPEWVSRLTRPLVLFNGFYFYAPESVAKQADWLREIFALQPKWHQQLSTLVNLARADCDTLIGFHLRRGDYRTFCGGVMFYDDVEFLHVARSIRDQLPGRRVKFALTSDEPIHRSAFRDLFCYVSAASDPVLDMYLLAACDYIVGPNSTFSHWASYYGGVPLHILDYKAVARFGWSAINHSTVPVTQPKLTSDFVVFDPKDFARFASGVITPQ